MRFALALGLASIVLSTGALYGCSSSSGGEATEEPDAATPPIGTGAPTASPPSTPTTTGGGDDAGVKTGDGGGTGPGTGGGDGGGTVKVDGGPASSLCNATSTSEIEANDTGAAATPLTAAKPGFCGTLSGATDVDFGSFVLPAAATSFNFNLHMTKSVEVFLNVGTQHVPISGNNLPFQPGEKYTIEVRPKGGQAGDYRVDVAIK